MTTKQKLLYQYEKPTANAIDKIKKITGISTTTKAITKAVLEYPRLVSDLDKADARIEALELALNEIKEIHQARAALSKKFDKLMSKV